MRAILLGIAILLFSHAARGGAWPQPEGEGMLINQAGYAVPEGGGRRVLTEGYSEWGLGEDFTAVLAFDSVLEPESSLNVWHGTAGIRYSLAFDDLPGWRFGLEPRFGYQFHDSAITDPVFAGDGWSYGLRLDAGRSLEVWDRHAFANLGISAATRSQAEGEFKLDLVAGIDLAEDWQAGVGYFGTYAPGEPIDPGAYSKHDISLYLRWRFEADQAISASVTQTVSADRTAPETTIRLALWTYFKPEPAEEDEGWFQP